MPEDVLEFYTKLSNTVKDVSQHAMLLLGGRYECPNFSRLHTNRNGHHLINFIEEHKGAFKKYVRPKFPLFQ